jgi:hypothetical protein
LRPFPIFRRKRQSRGRSEEKRPVAPEDFWHKFARQIFDNLISSGVHPLLEISPEVKIPQGFAGKKFFKKREKNA